VLAERKSGTLLQVRWTLRSCPWTPLVALLAVPLSRNRKEQQTFPRSTNPALVLESLQPAPESVRTCARTPATQVASSCTRPQEVCPTLLEIPERAKSATAASLLLPPVRVPSPLVWAQTRAEVSPALAQASLLPHRQLKASTIGYSQTKQYSLPCLVSSASNSLSIPSQQPHLNSSTPLRVPVPLGVTTMTDLNSSSSNRKT
jgi:hypothetical protein